MLKYCSIGSGSSGNCHYIGYKNTNLLVDAGLSGKKITTNLKEADVDLNNINGLLITHEHADHIKGAGILSRKLDVPIFANMKTWQSMRDKLGEINPKNIKVFENDKMYCINDIYFKPFSIEHDAADPVAYNFFTEQGSKLSIATDLGHINDYIRENILDSKMVILESNYDPNMLMMGSYPYSLKRRVMSEKGHLSNEDAANFCIELVNKGTEKILLGHLSKENNFPELAYETSKSILAQNNIIVGQDVKLDVLLREEISLMHNL